MADDGSFTFALNAMKSQMNKIRQMDKSDKRMNKAMRLLDEYEKHTKIRIFLVRINAEIKKMEIKKKFEAKLANLYKKI